MLSQKDKYWKVCCFFADIQGSLSSFVKNGNHGVPQNYKILVKAEADGVWTVEVATEKAPLPTVGFVAVSDGLEVVDVTAPSADTLTATLPYASQFTATITVKGEGYQSEYYVIDIPVVK